MANIAISGTIEVQDLKGQNYTLNGTDFIEDEHDDGTMSTFGYDTGDWSIDRDVEKKNGVISWNDWQLENCTIIQDDISFS